MQIGGDEGQGGEASEEATAEQYAVERRIINLITSAYPATSLIFLVPDTSADVGRRVGSVSHRELLNLLQGRSHDEDDDENDGGGRWGHRFRRRRPLNRGQFPKIPSDKGRELMNSGSFGANDISSPLRKKKQLARRILDRELGIGDRSYRRLNQGVIAQVSFTRRTFRCFY